MQWAIGTIGPRALRGVIVQLSPELAGLYVNSRSKAGRDAGKRCGLVPTGAQATADIGDILALRQDCVLYMPP